MPDRAKRRTEARFRITRWLSGAGILIAGLAAAGATYQAVATVRDKDAYPAPGKMVDVGGHRVHLQVAGEAGGRPTVILEAGIGSFSSNWAWVQTELANFTQVVAYDRAGLGWSDPGPGPRDARTSALELHTALQKAEISPPYVLAGHSYGGLVVRVFTALYPDEVVGMILVDASHPDQWTRIPESNGGRLVALSNRILAVLAQFGFFRVFDILTPQVAAGLPARQYAEMKAILALPGSSSTGADALAVWDDLTRPQVNAAPKLGNLPLAVLSVSEQPRYGETLSALQDELPGLSTDSWHDVVEGATHESLVSRRENAARVAAAIRRVVEAAYPGIPLSGVRTTR